MSVIPYMPLYIADYLADAAHLTTTEHGAYLLLIMNYWQRGKPLDNSNGRLANVARMSNEEWAKIEPTLAEFFDIDGDQWSHKRIERELEHFRTKSDKAKAAGKASAQRRSNGRSTDVQQTLNHTEADTDTDTYKAAPLPPEQAGRSRRQVKNLILKGAGVRLTDEVRELTRKRAEGLGLPVEAILAETRDSKPDNADAYFRAICRRRLKIILPGLSDELANAAFERDGKAFASLCGLLTMGALQ